MQDIIRWLAVLLFAVHPIHAAVVNSTWTDTSADGLWNTGANWSPSGTPNNGANTYNVTINPTGLPSGATISSTIVISSLSILGSTAGLTTNANLTVTGSSSILGELDVNSLTLLGSLGNFSGTTLAGGTFSVGNATLKFTGANIVTNAATIKLTNANAHIQNQANNANALTNLMVNDVSGTLAITDQSFTTAGNLTNDGIIGVIGTAVSNSFTVSGALANFSGTTLTGGKYDLSAAAGKTATFKFPGANIATNAAIISLDGQGSQIVDQNNANALANFALNDLAGRFEISDRNYSTPGAFTNKGTIGATANSVNTKLTITGSLTNFSGTTLTDGELDVANYSGSGGVRATIQFPGANIVTNSSTIVLDGPNTQIVNALGGNALSNFAVNTLNGWFESDNRIYVTPAALSNDGIIAISSYLSAAAFTVNGNFTNTGSVTVAASAANASLVVTGSLTSFSGTTLVDGDYHLRDEGGVTATLKFPGANIVTNAALIELSGQGAQILNQSNANALANFAVNDAVGEFDIKDRTFTTAGNFTNNGILGVNGWLANGTFAVGGTFTNFSGTTLTGGEYDIWALPGQTATFKFPGANIVTNAAKITLIGSGSGIVNLGNGDALANLSTITASGSLTINSRTFAASGSLTNSGSVDIQTGAALAVSGAYTQIAGTTTLTSSGGAALSAGGQISIQGGTLKGGGHLLNDVTLGSAASVSLTLGGGVQFASYDSLAVTGTATLNGKLLVTFANSFQNTVSNADTFTLLSTTGAVNGAFSNAVHGGRLTTADGLGSFLVTIGANSIILSDYYPSSSFAAWKTGNFTPAELGLPAISGANADPDRDSLPNLIEYAMGALPHVSDSAGLIVSGVTTVSAAGYLSVTYTRLKAAGDATFAVEVSGDLVSWQSGPQFTSFVSRLDLGSTERITWRDNTPISGTARRFIRVRVNGP